MDFKTYWQKASAEQRADFAARCGTSVGYLNAIAGGFRKAGESLAIVIERESGGDVPVEVTRPDVDWSVIRGKTASEQRAA